jgi:hypothetical protein
MNTRFEVDDAENLKLNLQNLQGVWNDQQRDKFENAFEQILANYQMIEQATERYTQQLSEQIQIAQKQNDRLNALNK